MYPQNGNFNTSAFKKIEYDYAREIEKGRQVEFVHTLEDFDASGRPGTVRVDYLIRDAAGKIVRRFSESFKNEAGQMYEGRTY